MIIKTKFLGEVDIEESEILNFPKGIPGFEEIKEFVILGFEDNNHFSLLQSVNEEYISFIIVNPWDFYEEYDIEIKNDNLKILELEEEDGDKVTVYSIITTGSTLEESTINLLAPIIINTDKKIGKQIILNDFPYTTKHKLIVEEEV